MSYRFFAAMLSVSLISIPGFAQSAKSSEAPKAVKAKAVPRSGDGHPDFTGVWTNITITPLERPRDLAGKEFFTPQEAIDYAVKRSGL